jgi:hypothetical protein
MQTIIDENVTIIVKSIIGFATMLILFGLNQLKVKILLSIEKQKIVKDRELLHKIASEGFAMAEQALNGSSAKYNAAFSYTSEMLGKAGVKITGEEIRAAVEKAVLDYNAKTKNVQYTEYKKPS